MRLKRLVLKFSGKNHVSFLILCLAAVFCFCQTINAQSGRRTNKGTVSPKPPPPDISQPKINPPVSRKPDEKILSLIVLGREKTSSLFSYSNDFDTVLKECVKTLEEYAQKSGSGLIVKKGEKMKLEEAIEQAKKEKDAHILWVELVTHIDSYRSLRLDYLDYVILTPQEGKRLTAGRAQPEWLDPAIGQGGIRQVPSARSRNPVSSFSLKAGAQEIVAQLIRQEWL